MTKLEDLLAVMDEISRTKDSRRLLAELRELLKKPEGEGDADE